MTVMIIISYILYNVSSGLSVLSISLCTALVFCVIIRGTQRRFSENICSEDDLRSRIFGTFVVKFLACLPLL